LSTEALAKVEVRREGQNAFLDLTQRFDLIFSAFPAPLVSQAKGMTNEREAACFFWILDRIHGFTALPP
jgi:hypothetical protein